MLRYRCPQMRMPARRRDAANSCAIRKERNDAGAAFGDNPEGWASLGAHCVRKTKGLQRLLPLPPTRERVGERAARRLFENNQTALLTPSTAPQRNPAIPY